MSTPHPPSRPDPMRRGKAEPWYVDAFGLGLVVVVVLLLLSAAFLAPRVSGHSRADLLAEVRNARGDAIAENATLTRIARQRAQEITTDFDHRAGGLALPWAWGEILAWEPDGYPDPVEAAVIAWQAADGHRDVLLGDWNAVGVGTADANGRHYFVAVFALIPRRAEPEERPPRDRRPARQPETRQPAAVPRVTLPPTSTADGYP